MPTKNPRVNISFKHGTAEDLKTREDLYLSKLAEKLDKDGVKTYTHTEVWELIDFEG